jgi:hypothetical protein
VEPDVADTFVQPRVADSVRAGALLVTLAAGQAVPRDVIAIGEAGAPAAIRAAITRIEADTHLANLAEGTRIRAIAAEPGVGLSVDAVERTSLEIGLANAFMCLDIADLVVTHALVVDTAAPQAVAGFRVAVCEARATRLIDAAIPWVDTAPGRTDEPGRAAHVAVATEARVCRGVHALRVADLEWRLAVDSTCTARATICTAAACAAVSGTAATSVRRRHAAIRIALDGKLGVRRKLARVAD